MKSLIIHSTSKLMGSMFEETLKGEWKVYVEESPEENKHVFADLGPNLVVLDYESCDDGVLRIRDAIVSQTPAPVVLLLSKEDWKQMTNYHDRFDGRIFKPLSVKTLRDQLKKLECLSPN